MLLALPSGSWLPAPSRGMTPSRRGLSQAWERFRAYRATLADLRSLTDRQLADVGLTRATRQGDGPPGGLRTMTGTGTARPSQRMERT